MKKYKLIINILLVAIFVSSIVAFGVISNITSNNWAIYINSYSEILNTTQNTELINEIKEFYSQTLCLTFSIIFSVLSTIASAATFIFLNFKVWKEKSNNFNTNS